MSVKPVEFSEKIVDVNRVAKVVKGGRRFSFSTFIVVGDKNGQVGFGLGKANEVPDALRKAKESAMKSLVTVARSGTTIPFEVTGRFGSSKVVLRPASSGTGVIAGAGVRSVLELAGVSDVLTKAIGSRNPSNLLAATFDALAKLEDVKSVAARRGKTVEDLQVGLVG